jgi:hypothetical protein
MALLNLTGTGLVSSGASLEALSVWSCKVRVNKSVFLELPLTFTFRTLVDFVKPVSGLSGDRQRIRVARNDLGVLRLQYENAVTGVSSGYVIDIATLPEYVVIYAQRLHGVGSNGCGVALYDDAGVVYDANFVETNGQNPLATGSGTGAFTLNGDSLTSTWDGLAIYSAILPASERFTPPAPGDANIVAFWPFTETSGSTATSTVVGPPSMSLTGASWLSGGLWGDPPPVVLTPDATVSNSNWSAVGAASLHAALAAGDADYITASTAGAVSVVALSDPSPLLTLTDASFTVRARLN